MRLIYTDIGQNLTNILAREAFTLTETGKRVFYLAPNSLSFEKERQVLARLPQQASLDIIVTRFAQMARYLTLNVTEETEPIDSTGLSMLFYRTLSQLTDQDLRVYGRLRQSMDFIQQLVDLYQELQEAQLTISDLTGMDSADKLADLHLIFTHFYALLQQENYQSQTKIGQLTQQILAGQLQAELMDLALVIDGFTRFSAEEAALVAALEAQGVSVLIGTYASQKAYQSSYISGNLYQAGVDFLRELAIQYGVKPEYLTDPAGREDRLARISAKMAALYDFSDSTAPLTSEDRQTVQIWEAVNQKEETVHVAKQIRHHLAQGYRYKDILVLLGDIDSYRLQIGKIFEQYEIPYYFAKAEGMSQHPLVSLIDSLLRIKRYHFQTEDVLNLLKTGLYGRLSQTELDKFAQYVSFAQIKGAAKFSRDFTINQDERFDLDQLNQLRQAIVQPLLKLFQVKPQSGSNLLQQLTVFLKTGQVNHNLAELVKQGNQVETEQAEQVWQLFTGILQQFGQIFGQEKLSIDDCLRLIRAGMAGASYRTVPPTVDVVKVRSYDLITPQASKLVFAIGLTQSHFPKTSKNTSLISDQERLAVNQAAGEQRLEIASGEQSKRSHFTALSLINSATDHLVLSAPQILQETQESMSPYLLNLLSLGIPKLEKGRADFEATAADVGNYKGLLSAAVELNRQEIEAELEKEQQTFWSAAVRYLRKKLAKEGVVIPHISGELHTQPLAPETLAALYPVDQPLRLSASSLTDFYNSEYKYFLRHVLRLEELQSVLPDMRVHGNFLHKVFEQVLQDYSSADFDQKVSRAVDQISQSEAFRAVYSQSAETRFSHDLLTDIARSTAAVLRDDQLVTTLQEEASFQQELKLADGRPLSIIGKIDRLDQLKDNQAYGVVDYKSSDQRFRIGHFYNGLSPQLLTYLMAIKQAPQYTQTDKLFGAVYLHMTDPVISLNKLKQLEDILKESQSSLQFKGLFLEEESLSLPPQYGKTRLTTFTQEELDTLLAYTAKLYQTAGQKILQGHFAINPYSEDGRTVAGDQYSSITHFETSLHLSSARFLSKLGRKKEDWLAAMTNKKGRSHDL